jgi:hypothetical protein
VVLRSKGAGSSLDSRESSLVGVVRESQWQSGCNPEQIGTIEWSKVGAQIGQQNKEKTDLLLGTSEGALCSACNLAGTLQRQLVKEHPGALHQGLSSNPKPSYFGKWQ